MSDLIQGLKSQTGLETHQVEGGLGAIFELLKSKLPPEVFDMLQKAIPQANSLIHALQSQAGQEASGGGGGLLGSIAEIAGKIFGGQGADLSDLIAGLGKAGFTIDQAKEFLPKAIAMIRQILPDDIFEKIVAALPALASILSGQTDDAKAAQ